MKYSENGNGGISEMTYQTSDGIYVVPLTDLTA